jgi:hypothetical protein
MLRKRAWRGVCPEECSHVTKKMEGSRPGRTRAVGGRSTGADTDNRRAVDRGGHGQSEGSRPGRTRAVGGQSTGAESGVAGAGPA